MRKNKQFDVVVYIGRFQPPHLGHVENMNIALEMGSHLIIVVGSANTPRTPVNPWTFPEREAMIRSMFTDEVNSRITIVPVEDRLYSHETWLDLVRDGVNNAVSSLSENEGRKIALLGYEKDDSSSYISDFPWWQKVEVEPFHLEGDREQEILSSTTIRSMIFKRNMSFVANALHQNVYRVISDRIRKDASFDGLREEYDHYVAEAKLYENLPYGYNFFTVDAVVLQSGYVLMVRRAQLPGKGLWALPGGHVGTNETNKEAVLRELVEETQISVPTKVLSRLIGEESIFDHPERSLRCRLGKKTGRTVTVAYPIRLSPTPKLPRVKPSHESLEVRWFTLKELGRIRDQIFEDHLDIIIHLSTAGISPRY